MSFFSSLSSNGVDLVFILSYFSRVRLQINRKFNLPNNQLLFLLFAYQYTQDNFYFTIPAICKVTGARLYNSHNHKHKLINSGYIEPYTPPMMNNCTGGHNNEFRHVKKRKRTKRGQLYIVTPKGKKVINYLIRCYNDIYREVHQNG